MIKEVRELAEVYNKACGSATWNTIPEWQYQGMKAVYLHMIDKMGKPSPLDSFLAAFSRYMETYQIGKHSADLPESKGGQS